jgi:hypothetical protein
MRTSHILGAALPKAFASFGFSSRRMAAAVWLRGRARPLARSPQIASKMHSLLKSLA